MGKINILDINVANMIAAGEVVERPASVVKELAENSIDAGANQIVIEIKNGGMTYIRVTDNGSGIERNDVVTAFKRHATSKIKDENDLDKIFTLGFRGEALASIASVARVEIFTKTRDESIGKSAIIEGGELIDESDAGCSDGTTIVVRNLFFNTPARMKFLKKDSTEASYITDAVQKLILGNPDVSIKLINSGKVVLSSEGRGDLLDAIYTVYGKDFSSHMLKADYSNEHVKVTGFVGDNSLSRPNRTFQTFFLNGRHISNKTMSAAMSEAFKNNIMIGKFPVGVLNITVSSNFVDVNVHPTKMEVRFSDDRKIFDAVYWAVKNAVTQEKFVPDAGVSLAKMHYESQSQIMKQSTQTKFDSFINAPKTDFEKSEKKEAPFISKSFFENENCVSTLAENTQIIKQTYAEQPCCQEDILEEPTPKEAAFYDDFKIIGQVFDTYIIIQTGDEMMFIDQHAAHERLCFEKLLEEYKTRSVISQMLMVPVTIDLSPSETALVEKNIRFFSEIGFDIELFGDNTIMVRMTPEILPEHEIRDLVIKIIDVLEKGKQASASDIYETSLYTIACKKAIKGNSSLSFEEMDNLVKRVLSFDHINTCPHGRPIMIKMSKYQMEKNFKRIV